MSQALIKSLPHILVLTSASPKLIKLVLQEGDQDLFDALYEILTNVKEGKVTLTATARKVLYENNPLDRILKSKRKRSQLLRYGPKILPVILPSVLSQICDGSTFKQ